MNEPNRAPTVSIGMPVYNGERYLTFAIESVLAQTFTDFELIISDNGSTDSTPDICKHFAAMDSRIIVHRQAGNRGAAFNFNFVFHESRGRYFKWACHDDVMAPAYLERCVAVLDAKPDVVLCYPKTVIIDADGANPVSYRDDLHLVSPSPVTRFRQLLFRGPQKCNPVLGLIRREVLARANLIGAYRASDEILLAQLALLGKYFEAPEELALRREHPGSSIRANPKPRQIYTWFDPQVRGRFHVPVLRQFYEYVRCVLRSGVSAREKAECVRLVLKRTWRRRSLIWRALRAG